MRSPVGSDGRQQRALAVDALVAEARDLRREAAEQDVVDARRVVPRHAGDAGALRPHLARRVDEDFGDVLVRQPLLERRKIGGEIDA